MNPRRLTLLSPYRLPTDNTLYMGDEEIASILEGHAALWHPAALAVASQIPRLVQPYDHEQPSGDHIFAFPDNPPLMLPEDWCERARAAGSIVFTASRDRQQTQQALLEALASAYSDDPRFPRLASLSEKEVRSFLGIGLGYLILEALFEATSHENVISQEDLFLDLSNAVSALVNGDGETVQTHLQAAADRLLSAREVVYPVTIYVVDLFISETGSGWQKPLEAGQPPVILATGQTLERMEQEHPEVLGQLRERVAADHAEVIGGIYAEREDPLLPIESQLWNVRKGQAVSRKLLGQEARVFARRRTGFHAQLPLFLQSAGLARALFVSFDDALLPSHHATVVSWPSHDGKQVDAFTRIPHPAESPQTYFHLAHHLHQTIMQDQSATIALVHKDPQESAPWYEDWLALTRLAPVLGRWVTISNYFNEVMAGDYTSATSPDEFHTDYLSERTSGEGPHRSPDAPISAFADHTRGRRRLDAAWTFLAILRSLGGAVPDLGGQAFGAYLESLEDRLEAGTLHNRAELVEAQQHAATALAQRLVARTTQDNPGWLLLNGCGFTRRVALEFPGRQRPIPTGGPVKASQLDGDLARVVVEVPPLGFAWVGESSSESPPTGTRIRLADERTVRNEFFEAEIDPNTGGLREFRDTRRRIGRLGQQLVWNPGSRMQVQGIQVTSTGPALGEIISHGILTDDAGGELARFRQRFRAWLGRPMLELRVELEPTRPVEGYPWHSYFGLRFAWREELVTLVRGASGLRAVTSQNRPESPDYLEIRVGKQNTVLFPGGLPFLQRHGNRMVDLLLVCEGEKSQAFEIGIGLDREQPMQTALGMASPVAVVATTKGPPPVGATGWLYHLDASNLLLTSLRPARDHPNGVIATLVECTGAGSPAQFRCVRDPVRAVIQDLQGSAMIEGMISGDAIDLEASANDLLQLRVEFS